MVDDDAGRARDRGEAGADWPRLEEDLRKPVLKYLKRRGLEVRHEVWINGRIADLFAFDDGDGTTVAVELKLSDWKQALGQAMAYQLGAVYTYVAIPLVEAPRALRQPSAFRSRNVGLLGVAPPRFDEGDLPGFAPASGGAGAPDHLRGGGVSGDGGGRGAPAPGPPQVRELIEAGPSERFLPFLAEKIVRDAKRPKRVPTVMPRDV